jgi:type IV secretory pathway VirB6-like protein
METFLTLLGWAALALALTPLVVVIVMSIIFTCVDIKIENPTGESKKKRS